MKRIIVNWSSQIPPISTKQRHIYLSPLPHMPMEIQVLP